MEVARLQIAVDSSGVRTAQREIKTLGNESGKTESRVTSLAKSAAALAVFAGIAGGVRLAINASRDFNQAISQLSAITGAAGEDLAFYEEQAKLIGQTTTLSASQAAEAFKLIASAKPDLLESRDALAEVTREAVSLAEAAGIDLPTAAAALGNSLNQFGADADEAGRFINVLAAGSKFGSSAIADTTVALKNAGAAANAVGASFEETNAAIQALAKGGIQGGEAGTNLRNILLKLEADTNQKLRPSIVGVTGAIQNLAKEQLSITDLTQKFGTESVVSAQTLIDNADAVGQLETALTGTNTAYEQARINNDNLAGDQKALQSATEALAIAFGQKLDPAVRSSTQGMTAAVNAITGSLDAILISAQVVAVLFAGKLSGALAASASGMIANAIAASRATVTVNAFNMVVARTTVAANVSAMAVRGLSTAMAFLGGPVGLVITGVGLLAMTIYNMGDESSKARPKLDNLSDGLYIASTAAERAQRNMAGLLGGIEKLNRQELDLRVERIEEVLTRQTQNLARYQRLFEAGNKGISVGLIDQTKANIELLNRELDDLRKKQATGPAEGGTTSRAGQDGIEALKQQLELAKVTGEARARLAAIQRLGAEATAEEREEAAALAAQIYRLEESQKARRTESDKMTDAIKDQVLAIQMQADMLGMTETETELYKLQLAGATDEQIRAAATALQLVDAYNMQAEAARRAAQAEEDKRNRAIAQVGQFDPIAGEQKNHMQELEDLRVLNEMKLIEDARYLEIKGQLEREHAETMLRLEEERFRQQSFGNELLMASLDQVGAAASNAFANILSGAGNSTEAIQELGRAIIQEGLNALIQMGVQYVKNLIIGQSAQATATAGAVASGTAMAAAYAPAAALASLASFGANAIPASTGIASTVAMAKGMALMSFDGGGFTGYGPRSGGMDGKGGFPAMLHPNETVIDHTKGQGMGTVVNIHNAPPGTQVNRSRGADGQEMVDVVLGDINGDGPISQALGNRFGMQRVGQ